MRHLRDIFDSWDSIIQMAADVGESHWAVTKWWRRKSIPSKHWPKVIKALEAKGQDISAADLLTLHARRKKAPSFGKLNNRVAP